MSGPPVPGTRPAQTVDPTRYALGGHVPRTAVRPTGREEVADVLRATAAGGLLAVPWGAGVALARETAPVRHDLALDLSGLDRIVEYDPEDFTLTAECGTPVAALRAALAARGQELPLEAPFAARATLGGLLAADGSGSRRLRFGAPHDRILGARFVLADGTFARSGGRVVKNVAGYAIHRLLCGSRGGLAVIIEASLKLAPAPGARVALCYELDATTLADPGRWTWLPPLEPSLATVVGTEAASALPPPAGGASAWSFIVGLEDDAPRVAEQEMLVRRALGTPRARVEGDAVVALTQALADLEEQDGPRRSYTTAGNTPAALGSLLGLAGSERLVFHAPAGRLHLFGAPGDADANEVAGAGFVLREARGVSGSKAGPHPAAGILALRRRIRAALDPAGRLALGERWAAGRT